MPMPADWERQIAAIIDAEVDRRWDRRPRLDLGCLERGDLTNAGWLAVLQATARHGPDAPLGLLRLCARGAVGTALRQEWRARGRVPRTIRWPVYWPQRGLRLPAGPRVHRPYRVRRCHDCATALDVANAARCAPCAAARRLVRQRAANARYYRRRKALAA